MRDINQTKTWKPKLREAKYKLMKAIKAPKGDLVDCVRVRIASYDSYLKEVATGQYDDERKVLKMNDKELETHKLLSKNGVLLHYNSTKIASTVGLKSKNEANLQAFVMGKDGSLYTATHTGMQPDSTGFALSHGSFLSGKPAELAGMISINDEGKIDKISDNSGHYAPDKLDMYRGIKKLQQEMPGVFAQGNRINY